MGLLLLRREPVWLEPPILQLGPGLLALRRELESPVLRLVLLVVGPFGRLLDPSILRLEESLPVPRAWLELVLLEPLELGMGLALLGPFKGLEKLAEVEQLAARSG